MNPIWLAPSLLAADFSRLGEESSAVISAGADLLHIDVMDNHYVPNLTMGPLVCQSLLRYDASFIFDVHLMIKPVDNLIPAFAKAGAKWISFHPEASEHVDRTIKLIHSYGCKAGLALNPATPLSFLDYTLPLLDYVLVMSVNPGFGGQAFIPEMLEKVRQVRQRIVSTGRSIRLQVDGGINPSNICQAADAGADTFVVGSALFHSENYEATLALMRNNLVKGFGNEQ